MASFGLGYMPSFVILGFSYSEEGITLIASDQISSIEINFSRTDMFFSSVSLNVEMYSCVTATGNTFEEAIIRLQEKFRPKNPYSSSELPSNRKELE